MSAFLLMKTIYSFNTFKFSYNDYKNIIQDEIDITKSMGTSKLFNLQKSVVISFPN